jgi:hypothetical protein
MKAVRVDNVESITKIKLDVVSLTLWTQVRVSDQVINSIFRFYKHMLGRFQFRF